MTKFSFRLLSCVMALGSVAGVEAEVLTIRIYNYAGVERGVLAEAGETARRIYESAGVETRWIECRTRPDQPVFDASCSQAPGPRVIRMRVMPTVSAKMPKVGGSVYGFALPSKSGGFGGAATIFWDRVAAGAAAARVDEEKLLGCVMAHEAGHLILGFESHSGAGLMSGRWTRAELQRIGEGALGFVGREKKRVARGVTERVKAGG